MMVVAQLALSIEQHSGHSARMSAAYLQYYSNRFTMCVTISFLKYKQYGLNLTQGLNKATPNTNIDNHSLVTLQVHKLVAAGRR